MSYCSFVSAEMARIAYWGSFCYKKRILPLFRGKKTFFQPPFHLTSATRVLVGYNYRTIVVYKKKWMKAEEKLVNFKQKNKKGDLKETPSNTKTRKMRYLEGIKMFLKM